ncbi:ABC transporter substrate-binding protein [uncultured Boseongicola sp.]|jgi:NitT/TauT family transport system substrate-binding protein|uniref:ABC transporter substrate-binding protein n=1 Tax=uncultured Boseongicola sp. TaxID=1648499 RepID=UPI002617B020|nr:ABC transporter substrate-binding protein [uncultured Boseongicola sp.]
MKMFKAIMLSTTMAVVAAPSVSFAQDTTISVIKPTPRSAVFFPLVVGEALGYFADEGITVNLLPSDTSIPYVAFIQNGQADLAMLDPNETINALNAGANINTVYEVMQNAPEGIAVLAGGEYTSMESLVGTTVGLVSDRDRAFLQAALDIAGNTIDDVQTVVLGESGPTLAAAIRDGNVSAISGSVFDWAALVANGIELDQVTPEELLASPANTLAMNADMIEEKREAMEGFFRAWSKGMHVGATNPDAVEAMLRQAVPEEWEVEAAGMGLFQGVLPMNISTTERMGDMQSDVWTNVQPRMLSSGAIEKMVDVSTFLNDTYIEAANDFDKAVVEADAAAWLAENQ